MLDRYMELAMTGSSPELPLFRGKVHTKSGERLRKKGCFSYTRMREIVLEKLSELGLDRKLFGLHSLRSGGASAAAGAGVPDRLFKHHGRWRCKHAKDGNIKDSDRQSYRELASDSQYFTGVHHRYSQQCHDLHAIQCEH